MSHETRLVECASVDCARTFPTRSLHRVQYCPACREKRKWLSRLPYKELEDEIAEELIHDPDFALNKKLDEAEFSILLDAGPEDIAFRRGARFTYQEVRYLLQYESIAVDSVLVHTQTGCPMIQTPPAKPGRPIKSGASGSGGTMPSRFCSSIW
jgi:hypothetical protein